MNLNNLTSGINKVNQKDMSYRDRQRRTDQKTTVQADKTTAKQGSKYIKMANFMIPETTNFPTIEEIKKKLVAGKIQTDNTLDEDDESKFIKVVTMAPGFVYGVDTRKYYPKKNVQVGPSISDMSG